MWWPSGSRTAAIGSLSSPRTAKLWRHALANADEVRRPDPGSWRASRERQELPLPLSAADHVKHPGGEDQREKGERRHPRWHPRRHPREERIIPKSRDFH